MGIDGIDKLHPHDRDRGDGEKRISKWDKIRAHEKQQAEKDKAEAAQEEKRNASS